MALIERKPGSWMLKGLEWNDLNTCNLPVPAQQAIYGALCKLKDYEESGMDPDQVAGMKESCERFLNSKV